MEKKRRTKKIEQAKKKTQKGLQIESLEENPPRKSNTFSTPSSSDVQNAPVRTTHDGPEIE
jgi:hypothetical protein